MEFVCLSPPRTVQVQADDDELCIHEFPDSSVVDIPDGHYSCLHVISKSRDFQAVDPNQEVPSAPAIDPNAGGEGE